MNVGDYYISTKYYWLRVRIDSIDVENNLVRFFRYDVGENTGGFKMDIAKFNKNYTLIEEEKA